MRSPRQPPWQRQSRVRRRRGGWSRGVPSPSMRAGVARRAGRQRPAKARGRSMRISVPRPGVLVMLIAPPSPSMMFLAIGRPSPVPPRLVVKYGIEDPRQVGRWRCPRRCRRRRSTRRAPSRASTEGPAASLGGSGDVRRSALRRVADGGERAGPRRHRLARVHDQIDQREAQPLGVGRHRPQRRVEIELHRRSRRRLSGRRRLAADRVEIRLARARRGSAARSRGRRSRSG